MKRLVLICTAIFTIVTSFQQEAFAQDPEFSQFYAAPLHLNPALAGISQGPRIAVNYRNQWPGFNDAFVTYALSYDQHIKALSGGIGVILSADRIAGGILNTYKVGAMYSYQLKLAKNFGVKIGAQGSYNYKHIDFGVLRFHDQINVNNPSLGFIDEFNNLNATSELAFVSDSKSYADVSAGMVGFSPKVYVGVALKHLIQPNESFTGDNPDGKLPLRIAIHGGASFDFSPNPKKEAFFSPNVLFVQQSNFTQLNIGAYVNFEPVFGGVWYRHTFSNPDAVIALFGISIDPLRVGYSYDFTMSELNPGSGGAHEISLVLNFGSDKNSLTTRTGQLDCPQILNY